MKIKAGDKLDNIKLKSIDNYFSYRFNIFPESIGAIAYLNNNQFRCYHF